MTNWFLSFILSFIGSLLLGFLLIPVLSRLKFGQPVLSYVKEHENKRGTPTMGGIIFLLSITSVYFILNGFERNRAMIALTIMLGYGIVGALDDYIKIKSKNNQGLKAYQKIFFQLSIALIAAFFAGNISTALYIPFLKATFDLKTFSIVFYVFVFLAITNGVNLTDGLDGLVSKVSIVYFLAFCVLLGGSLLRTFESGDSFAYNDYNALLSLVIAGAGALLAFLYFNTFPAKVFMGDTGSLGLGGLIAATAVFTEYSLFLPLLGIMFVVSCLSVISQVAYFKATKGKRIFLMAPYHHHLEEKGFHENRVTVIYLLITIIVSVVTLFFSL